MMNNNQWDGIVDTLMFLMHVIRANITSFDFDLS